MKRSLFPAGERVRQCVYNRSSSLRFMSLLVLPAILFCFLYAVLLCVESERSSALAFETSVPDSFSPSAIGGGTTRGSDDADAISRALRDAIATEPEPPFSASGTSNSVITQEIRYEMAEAEEVYIGWGINGWKPVPEELRPKGTKLHDGKMSTPMVHEGNSFVVKFQVPNGAVIDYGFWISRKRSGQIIGVWDGNGYPPNGYQTIARPNHPAVIIPTLDLEAAKSNAQRTYVPLVTQKILYHANGARDVSLVWGVNGWQPVSEDIRPSGTVLKENRMHTPMVRTDNTFIAKVQVPAGAILDYNFLITETNSSATAQIMERAEAFHQTVTLDGRIDVSAKVESAIKNIVQSESSENASKNSGKTQQFRYYLVHGGEVFLAALLALALLALLKLFVFSPKRRSR